MMPCPHYSSLVSSLAQLDLQAPVDWLAKLVEGNALFDLNDVQEVEVDPNLDEWVLLTAEDWTLRELLQGLLAVGN